MQIFAIHDCPVESARCLSNEQLRKMVTETAQLLSAAVREAGSEHTADAFGVFGSEASGRARRERLTTKKPRLRRLEGAPTGCCATDT